jgi:hypothetical protein
MCQGRNEDSQELVSPTMTKSRVHCLDYWRSGASLAAALYDQEIQQIFPSSL